MPGDTDAPHMAVGPVSAPVPARRGAFVLLEIANLAGGMGNSMVTITLPWLVLELTGSAARAGLVAGLVTLPALVAAPVAGWLVDRWGRRQVSIASDVLSALSVAAIPVVAAFGGLTFFAIAVLAVVGATFDPAGYTGRRSLLVDVAEATDVPLDRANGIHQGVFAVGWMVGPLVGAVLIATVGAVASFWAPFGLFVLAAVAVTAMGVGDAGQRARAARQSEGGELGGWSGAMLGLTTLWRDRALRTVTVAVIVLAAVYLPTESVILPTYFERQGSPASLGIVIAALAAGGAIGAFSYGWLRVRLQFRTIVRLSITGTAIAIVPMALLPPLAPLAVAAFVLGLAWGPMDPLLSSLVQQRVDDDIQGRVFGVQLSLFYAAPPLAMVATGFAIEGWGLAATYLAIAVTLVAVSVVLVTRPGLAHLDG